MAHEGNYNASDAPRQAVFSRWHNTQEENLSTVDICLANPLIDGDDLGQVRRIRAGFDIGGILSDGDMWKWWAKDVRKWAGTHAATANAGAKL
jgi:hypothetical protein